MVSPLNFDEEKWYYMYIKRFLKNDVFFIYRHNFVNPIANLVIYIPRRKYHVKPHSSPWFSAACAAVIAHRNHFFRFYQQNKSFASIVKFRLITIQASNRCKRDLETAKLTYANKAEESITSQKLGSRDFWRITKSVFNKVKSAIHPLFYSREVLSSASDKAKLLPENFTKNSKS